MAKKSINPNDVEAMYSRRAAPTVEPDMDPGEHIDTKIGRMPVFNHHDNQAPEDQHGVGYDNDATGGWVRGAASGDPTCSNEDGTKPTFDHSPPRNKMRR